MVQFGSWVGGTLAAARAVNLRVGPGDGRCESVAAAAAVPGRPVRALRRRTFAVAAGGLTGTGAVFDSDAPPSVLVRRRARRMEDDAKDRTNDPNGELEWPVPQPRHLGPDTRGVSGTQTQFLHEDVCRRRQQHANLVRTEPAAGCGVDLHATVRFLDPVLDVPAGAVIQLERSARGADLTA